MNWLPISAGASWAGAFRFAASASIPELNRVLPFFAGRLGRDPKSKRGTSLGSARPDEAKKKRAPKGEARDSQEVIPLAVAAGITTPTSANSNCSPPAEVRLCPANLLLLLRCRTLFGSRLLFCFLSHGIFSFCFGYVCKMGTFSHPHTTYGRILRAKVNPR